MIVDNELHERINTFLTEYMNYKLYRRYTVDLDKETFYIEFIDYLVSRGLKINGKL